MSETLCSACGAALSADASFCPQCGQKAVLEATPLATALPPEAPASAERRSRIASGCGLGCLGLLGLWLVVSLGVFGHGYYKEYRKKQWSQRLEQRFRPLAGSWFLAQAPQIDRLDAEQKRFVLELADNSASSHLEGEPATVLKASSVGRFLVITFNAEEGEAIKGMALYTDRMMEAGAFADAEAKLAGDELRVRLVDRDSRAESIVVLRRGSGAPE